MITDFSKTSIKRSLLLFVFFSCAGIIWMVSSQNALLDEYPRIDINSALSGTIVSREPSKSIVRIILQNQQKFTVPASRNYAYSQPDLNKFLIEGDQVLKKQGSDTLYIVRRDEKFFFRLGKFIDLPRSPTGATMPDIDFSVEEATLIKKLREQYNAKSVEISHPYIVTDNVLKHWIKVEFLNADFKDKKFNESGREVAINIYNHLINTRDFEKVEVSATERNALILTIRWNESKFFYRDSL